MPPLRWKFDRTDPQRDRVYQAEREVPFPSEPEFASLREIRAYVDEVLASPTWRALALGTRQENRGVEVRLGRGRTAHAHVETFGMSRIWLPKRMWTRDVVLHELAHCARGRMTLNHGPQFAASYVRLVRACWDASLADQLEAAYARHRVRVAPWVDARMPIPIPDRDQRDETRDEGAEEDLARQDEELEAAFAELDRVIAALAYGGSD